MSQNHKKPALVGPQVKLSIKIPCLQELDTEAESIILSATHPLSETELQQMISHNRKKKLQKNRKTKKDLRMTFQSPELRRQFEQVITQVPGREKQAKIIFDFLNFAQNGSNTPLCLHGNTGCGKTSLVKKISSFFQSNFNTVQTLYINCMSMWSPNHVYRAILSNMFSSSSCNRANKQKLAELLKKNFAECGQKDGFQPTKIIILDEIDQFMEAKDFIYNILELLDVGSKLVIILISNVIDLTLKFEAKIQSRMKFQTIIFKPYSSQEIVRIIEYKYPEIRRYIPESAITWIAKKIGNINSDIRILEKMHKKIENQFNRTGGSKPLDLDTIYNLNNENNKIPGILVPYTPVINILYTEKMAISNGKQLKNKDIQQEMRTKLFSSRQGSHFPKYQEMMLILCDLQDYGLISMVGKNKNCDMNFFDFGIKVHQSLMNLQIQQ